MFMHYEARERSFIYEIGVLARESNVLHAEIPRAGDFYAIRKIRASELREQH